MPACRKPLERPYFGHKKRTVAHPPAIHTAQQKADAIARMEEIDQRMDPDGYERRKADLMEHLGEDWGPWDD